MSKKVSQHKHLIFQYTMAGTMFGFLFPLAAVLNEIITHDLDFSWQAIQVIQRNQLLWIIDTAPLFLGFFAFNVGVRQKKLVDQNEKLEEIVNQRSKEIIRQKLFYEALVDNNPIAIVTLDQDQRIISINQAFQNLFGYHQEEVMGAELDDLIANPDRPQEAYAITQKAWRGNAMHEFGKRQRKDGQLVDVEIFGEQIRINGTPIGVVGLYRDITAEKEAREALSASEERFRIMFSDSPIALRMEDFSPLKKWLEQNYSNETLSLVDYSEEHPDFFTYLAQLPQITDLNDATLWMFGANDKEEMQHKLYTILSPECRKEVLGIVDSLRNGETTIEQELIYNRLDGKKIYTITKLTIIPGHEEDWDRILFSNMDITERKLAEKRLTYISLHDIMTRVYNRAFFEEEMSRLSKSRYYPISILVMDMDNLKAVNDQYGHQAGDMALQNMANIIKSCFRNEDVIARIGGDEMAVLLQGVDAEGAQKAKERIQDEVEAYNRQKAIDIRLSISIGCATAIQGESLAKIFKSADERMYQEKKQRKDLWS